MDSSNLDEYVSLVVDATVKSGLMRQMEAFRAGFNQVSNCLFLLLFLLFYTHYLKSSHAYFGMLILLLILVYIYIFFDVSVYLC